MKQDDGENSVARPVSITARQTIWKSLDFLTEEYGYQSLHQMIISQLVSDLEGGIKDWYNHVHAFVKEKAVIAGQVADDRITEEVYTATYKLAREAEKLGFSRLGERLSGKPGTQIFIGTTSCVEDHIVTAEGATKWIDALTRSESDREKLRTMIKEGPADGSITWADPADVFEALASICRHIVLKRGQKGRIRTSEEVRQGLKDLLLNERYQWPRSALGGAAAFTTQTALAFQHTPTMHAIGAMPTGILQRGHLPVNLKVVSDGGKETCLGELSRESMNDAPGHFTVSLQRFIFPQSLWGLNLETHAIDKDHAYSSELLVTGTKMPVGFGMEDAPLKSIGKEHEISLLTGYQYLQSRKEIDEYFKGMKALASAGNPVMFEYSPPRGEGLKNEIYALRKMQETPFTLISFNTSEVYDLFERLEVAIAHSSTAQALGLTEEFAAELAEALSVSRSELDPDKKLHWENGKESPEWLLLSGVLMQKLTNASLVRVRGMHADVTISRPNMAESIMQRKDDSRISKAEHIRNALFFCRQMAALKVAIEGGNFRGPEDIVPVEIAPNATELIAHQQLGDALYRYVAKQHYSAEVADQYRGLLVDNWFTRLPNGQYIFAALPQEFRVRDGGSQSAGDTMAVIFATEAAAELKAFVRK